ncbi:MAG: sulfurtransferase [Ignavibacteriales bacterium]|nr:sulfurtransferase [Ignavibacteriales bacterium]
MNKTLFFFLLLVLIASLPQQTNAQSNNSAIFVTTSWLAEHINDPSIVVLHVAPIRRDYERGHIPGARFLWNGWIFLSNPELSYELLPIEQLETTLEKLGVSNESRIILCGIGGNVNQVARVFVTLDYLGMDDRISILDGGFDAWKAEGKPVTKEIPVYQPGSFTPKLNPSAIVDAEYVKSNLHKSDVSIIDVRAPQFYNGTTSGGHPRAGAIPTAKNIFSGSLVDSTNKMIPMMRIEEKFDSAGVKKGNDVIVYCHSGVSACLVYAAARSLGYTPHLYDGSFEDWSSREDLPIEIPAKQDSIKK